MESDMLFTLALAGTSFGLAQEFFYNFGNHFPKSPRNHFVAAFPRYTIQAQAIPIVRIVAYQV
jgi:hypothetical protein